MSLFDRLDRVTSRTVDRVNAVQFVLEPAVGTPNGRRASDPDRISVIARGVLDSEPVHAPVEIANRNRTGNDLHNLVNGTQHVLSVDVTRYPDIKQVRQGDRIRMQDELWEVISRRPDGLTRVELILNKR
ncbi:hypothetical protein ACFOEZ_04095 [Tianweitania populi]|uniref:Uncharacterized protein n=1 Tax=Tianweitania populi TaxID=1607949 RepID=A0A8J3DT47_9HYPH|nr:hypothetical protein [Tianweitania populi]GHD07678.1 hypothetical protein GCM10016234_06360 [Tianweitania populi]